ncbi:YxeA family protein [Enterococcus rivorum]|uniref:YxeA family protein n=1 Tax=Enterococcus rivorum TaxID=762845 RepID=A0A1E5KXT3_9ENTE|nr:YxeA family protein [Enterococcus rivorum]MBP2099761.1 uncharacterized protein (TIGR01655 family) [Enterococcus rivorum]OEH82654.1 hypothetical protein BCR26_12555 [Enterococcus rivorum]
MKKILYFLIPFLLLSGGVWFGYNYYYGGTDYYTKIVTPGEVSTEVLDSGEKVTKYNYTQTAYSAKGKKTTQEMNEFRDKPLKMNAFIKLKVNDRKGIISWEEVQENEVPAKALEPLNKE